MFDDDLTLVYGFLIGMGVFVAVWFAFVAPSEQRDHERRLALIQKRIAEREQKKQDVQHDDGEQEGSRH